MKEFLFSYGTLQKEKVQMELFRRLLPRTKDVPEGYNISSIEIKDESFLSKGENKHQRTLIPSNNKIDKIEGTVFEISKEELLLADKYEPDNYKRIKVVLQREKRHGYMLPFKCNRSTFSGGLTIIDSLNSH